MHERVRMGNNVSNNKFTVDVHMHKTRVYDELKSIQLTRLMFVRADRRIHF